jgi:F-type H+-transporting ATPase subunit delta
MKNRTLVRRYTRGLVNAIHDEKEYREIQQQLADFQQFLLTQEKLNHILIKSLLPASKKQAVGQAILAKQGLQPKTSRFILLLISNGRLGLLADILEVLQDFWNEEQGISSFEVSSVVLLSDEQKKSLRMKLERLEKRDVFLNYKIDPELIGGVSIRQGNIVYDASLNGALEKLREKISEG